MKKQAKQTGQAVPKSFESASSASSDPQPSAWAASESTLVYFRSPTQLQTESKSSGSSGGSDDGSSSSCSCSLTIDIAPTEVCGCGTVIPPISGGATATCPLSYVT